MEELCHSFKKVNIEDEIYIDEIIHIHDFENLQLELSLEKIWKGIFNWTQQFSPGLLSFTFNY